jgi:hypothetical protein
MRQIIYTLIVICSILVWSCSKSSQATPNVKTKSLADVVGVYAGNTHFNEHDLYIDSTGLKEIVIDSTFPDTVWVMGKSGGNGIIFYFKNYSTARTLTPLLDTFAYDPTNFYMRGYEEGTGTMADYEKFSLFSNDSLYGERGWAFGFSYFFSHKNTFRGKKL